MEKIIELTPQELQAELEAKDIVIKEKDAVIKDQEGEIRVLIRKASPRSLGFYRSRFR